MSESDTPPPRTNDGRNKRRNGLNHRQKRVVLSEEEYVSTLSDIIERDYYPALNSLKRDVSILEKRKEGDIAGAVAIRRAARKLQQARELDLEEELWIENSTDSVRSIARPLHHESVDGFHQRVTSEDNQEFHKQHQQQPNQLLLLTHNNDTTNNRNKPLLIQPASTNALFFPPSHHPQQFKNSHNDSMALISHSSENDDNNNHHLTDSLMMPPPPNKKLTEEASKQLLVEYIPKPKNEKDIFIQPSQTRFPHQSESRLSQPNTQSTLITTTTNIIDTNDGDETTDLDEIDDDDHTTLSQQRKKRLEKERSSYVCMTPQITPNTDEINQSPIVTWGTIASTPLVLPSSSNFDLPPVPLKEQKARQMEAKLSKQRMSSSSTPKKHKRQKRLSTTPEIGTRTNMINARCSSAFGSALRASYSTPIHTPKNNSSRRSSKRRSIQQSTPKLLTSKQQKIIKPIISLTSTPTSSHSTENITDGLLHLK